MSLDLVFPHTFVPWFRAVAPHIHAYHGKTFVVAITGELIVAGKLNHRALTHRGVLGRTWIRHRYSFVGYDHLYGHGPRADHPPT